MKIKKQSIFQSVLSSVVSLLLALGLFELVIKIQFLLFARKYVNEGTLYCEPPQKDYFDLPTGFSPAPAEPCGLVDFIKEFFADYFYTLFGLFTTSVPLLIATLVFLSLAFGLSVLIFNKLTINDTSKFYLACCQLF